MKATCDRWAGHRKPTALSDCIEQAKYVVIGVVERAGEEATAEKYRLAIERILFGGLLPSQTLVVDPVCLHRTVRLGLRSRREVVAVSLRGELELAENDLLLPVILDPISNEKYVKIPPELSEKNTLRESRLWRRNPVRSCPPNPADSKGAPFVLFDEFMASLGELCRGLR